jgi:ABC-type phosphate transport system ATPase subunit
MHDLIPKSLVTGSIFVMGKSIKDYDSVEIRKKIGMVFLPILSMN